MKKRIFLLALMMCGVLGTVLSLTAQPAPAADSPVFEYERVVVRAFFDDPQQFQAVSYLLPHWDVHYDKGYVIGDVNAEEYQILVNAGLRLEVDENLTADLNRLQIALPGQLEGIPGFACYRTVEETFQTAQDIAANYPQLATVVDIGDSWEKTQNVNDGYDLLVLKLTNSAIPGPKPKLFIMSSVHAREYTPAELNTRFAEYLINNYGSNADATWLLDYHEVHLLLQANPDGRKQAETGLSWRKNTNNNYCSNTNTRGADLNRNFEFEWNCCGGSSGSQCSETYHGASAASEPEVQAIQNYVSQEFPDQRDGGFEVGAPITATGVFLDIHSYSELVLWPWGFTSQVTGNDTALKTLGRKFAYFNGYTPQQAIELYITDGTTDDFAYGELGLAAYTFELGTSFFQGCGVFETTIYPDNLQALIYAAKISRTPYLTPSGPETLNVALSAVPVNVGEDVTLTATLNDARFNNSNGTEPTQPIEAGEYYIDTPPWITDTTPIAYPLNPTDGTFNTNVEGAQATINTTGLDAGKHIIYVRGKDNLDNWGPVSAIFLYVIDPAIAPTIAGEVIAADTGFPLTATITANTIFQTTTDGDGLYAFQVISDTYEITAVPNNPAYGYATVENVVAPNSQTIQQDFMLYPYCDIFSDDIENGVNGWTEDPVSSPWAIVTESSHSPTHSWTDSPGGNYSDNISYSVVSPAFDLSDYTGIQLNFWQICDTEADYDYCTVEVSTDGGNSWAAVFSTDGNHTQWEQINVDLPVLDRQADAQIRFHLTSDVSITENGWHLDDVLLRGAGPACVTLSVPQANFSSTSPDALGEATSFSNSSTGGSLAYSWEFGDGNSSTEAQPTHTYAAVGTYTVTLTVSNTLGVDTTTGVVEILLAPEASFTTSSPTELGTSTTFTNSSTGDNLSYLWDFGDGETSTDTTPTHTYAAAGTYTVTLTASNLAASDTAENTVQVLVAPQAAFTSTGPDYLGETTVFTNTSTGTALTYLWEFGDGETSTEANPTHVYAATGTYTVTLTITNALGNNTITADIDILALPFIKIYLPIVR